MDENTVFGIKDGAHLAEVDLVISLICLLHFIILLLLAMFPWSIFAPDVELGGATCDDI
jgi:hypothetical protein